MEKQKTFRNNKTYKILRIKRVHDVYYNYKILPDFINIKCNILDIFL